MVFQTKPRSAARRAQLYATKARVAAKKGKTQEAAKYSALSQYEATEGKDKLVTAETDPTLQPSFLSMETSTSKQTPIETTPEQKYSALSVAQQEFGQYMSPGLKSRVGELKTEQLRQLPQSVVGSTTVQLGRKQWDVQYNLPRSTPQEKEPIKFSASDNVMKAASPQLKQQTKWGKFLESPVLAYEKAKREGDNLKAGGISLGLTGVFYAKSFVEGRIAMFNPSFYATDLPNMFKMESYANVGTALYNEPWRIGELFGYPKGFGKTTKWVTGQFIKPSLRTPSKVTILPESYFSADVVSSVTGGYKPQATTWIKRIEPVKTTSKPSGAIASIGKFFSEESAKSSEFQTQKLISERTGKSSFDIKPSKTGTTLFKSSGTKTSFSQTLSTGKADLGGFSPFKEVGKASGRKQQTVLVEEQMFVREPIMQKPELVLPSMTALHTAVISRTIARPLGGLFGFRGASSITSSASKTSQLLTPSSRLLQQPSTRITSLQRTTPITRQSPFTTILSRTTPITRQKPFTTTLSRTTPITRQSTRQSTRQKPIFEIPQPRIFKLYNKKSMPIKNKLTLFSKKTSSLLTQYVPDIKSSLLGIYGKKPKGVYGGLRSRPLLRKRRKKK